MKTNLPELTFINRGGGKTTAICEAARKINATVVTANHTEAVRIQKQYRVEAVSWKSLKTKGDHTTNYLVDTHAVSMAAQAYEDEIAGLKRELAAERQRTAPRMVVSTISVKPKRSWSKKGKRVTFQLVHAVGDSRDDIRYSFNGGDDWYDLRTIRVLSQTEFTAQQGAPFAVELEGK